MRDYPISLHLDSEQIILRSIGDEEPDPAVLSGSIVLDLHERTHIADIVLVFSGRAHIAYTDNTTFKTFNFELPIFHHDQSFLPTFGGPSSSSRPSSSAGTEARGSPVHALGATHGDTSTFAHVPPHLTSEPSSASSSGVNLPALNNAATGGHAHFTPSSKPHTLNPGVHRFPFHITIPGSLPASLRVGGLNTSTVSYRLKATLQKSGVFGSKKSVKRPILIVRGLSPDAAEYNQTLEIENTWPNKIMYSFTLPQKAFCAGESIPIALKFTPISKGVRVTQLVTNIKEHVTVLNKNSQPSSTTRDIVTKKHTFLPRSALPNSDAQVPANANSGHSPSRRGAHPVSMPPSRSGSYTDLSALNHSTNRISLDDHAAFAVGGSGGSSPGHAAGAHASTSSFPANAATESNSGNSVAVSGHSSRTQSRSGSRAPSPERIYYGRHTADPDFAGLVDDDAGEEVDVDAVIEIPVPLSATPSHSLEPILVSHKIKWSAFIKNLDGHTSELRCALPIHVLSPLLTEEARLASSGTRSLLFGPSGVLVPAAEGIQQVDLPSYADHVRDRVANIDTATSNATLAAPHTNTVQNNMSFVRSPWATPIGSPEQQHISGAQSPAGYFPTRPINWADSELLSTLAISSVAECQHPHHQSRGGSSRGSPATSRPGSRPGSRAGSRQNSRPASRASSPNRGTDDREVDEDGITLASASSSRREAEMRAASSRGSSSGFLSHLAKPLRPLTGRGGTASSQTSLTQLNRTASVQPEDRSMSTGSLSAFFGSHSQPRSLLGKHHPELLQSDGSSAHSHRQASQDATAGPRPDDLQAALEAAQAKQDKGKKRAHFSFDKVRGSGKGKQKASAFSGLLHDDDDEDEDGDPDASDDHPSHQHSGRHSPVQEHALDDHPDDSVSRDDETGTRILSQVPSYHVASRGFLGGVIPLSAQKDLPSYDESEALSTPGSPLHRTDTTTTKSSLSTTASGASR